ncbi:MAG: citrate synthase [Candidatus Omnitrophica bacterium]|nr:citrate synthase [Candidatus Omnitrophota bacterium]
MKPAKDAFSKGLEGVVAAQSGVCRIDGQNSQLHYRGYNIHDLVRYSTFEETAYLLLFGNLPTAAQLSGFEKQLISERNIPDEVVRFIQLFPKDIHSMAALRTAISYLSFFDKEADDKSVEANVRKAIRLIAKTPAVVACLGRAQKGEKFIAPKTGTVGTAASFLYMLKGKEALAIEVKMLDQYFILLAEHDLNASTFAARITASTLSDMYSAIVSAIGTLKGDLHGSANSRAMESILEVGDVSRVESYVDDALQNKKKLMGFGHRVYKGPDPRAIDLRVMARTLAEHNAEQAKWYAISEKLEKAVWEKKKLNCNVDFYSASVLYTVGIPIDLFTPMFAVSRMAGWTAHVVEQLSDNRLIRPLSYYVGRKDESYVPLAKRG